MIHSWRVRVRRYHLIGQYHSKIFSRVSIVTRTLQPFIGFHGSSGFMDNRVSWIIVASGIVAFGLRVFIVPTVFPTIFPTIFHPIFAKSSPSPPQSTTREQQGGSAPSAYSLGLGGILGVMGGRCWFDTPNTGYKGIWKVGQMRGSSASIIVGKIANILPALRILLKMVQFRDRPRVHACLHTYLRNANDTIRTRDDLFDACQWPESFLRGVIVNQHKISYVEVGNLLSPSLWTRGQCWQVLASPPSPEVGCECLHLFVLLSATDVELTRVLD